MTLQGKGFMIWQIPRCEGGVPSAIASTARSAGFTNVLIKIANGINPYNIDSNAVDLVSPVVQALRAVGMQVWGWHYVYGNDPVGEARIAVTRVQQLSLDGYIIDAEQEYKEAGKEDSAKTFMSQLRSSLPSTPIALSSYRYPNLHPELPWKAFLDKCDYNMPQVYWEQAHNAGEQLRQSVTRFQAISPFRPIIPTGPVYGSSSSWCATPSEILEFMNTAKSLNLTSVNFFSWDYRSSLSSLWDVIANYNWASPPVTPDMPIQLINAMNTHDPNTVTALYKSDAVHITAAQTVQGTTAIKNWYNTLFTQSLTNATFTVTGITGSGNSRHFTWTATSSSGTVRNGSDTMGIVNGKITYHYSFFTVS